MEGSGWVRQYIFQSFHGCRLRHLNAPLGVEHKQNWGEELYLIADKIALLTTKSLEFSRQPYSHKGYYYLHTCTSKIFSTHITSQW